ncbi:MAG: glycine cleavage system aminomethyltransferase GcvT [Phycisphaerae bacterium]|nr:glycine cleavage system aminomethyltransferase GcvT [Phycisphaerae bacterium]
MLKKTPLHSYHVQRGARMVEFAGWEMPLLYTGIVEEHQHTRRVASVFDVSHMGRIIFTGPEAKGLLQRVCTRQLGTAEVGQCCYGHVCNEDGGILDDVIISRYEDRWLMVCNASNRDRVLAWLRQHAPQTGVQIDDITESTLMVAIQGPASLDMLSRKLPFPIAGLKRYRFLAGSYFGTRYTIFRSGYTGEDGAELILPASVAPLLTGLLGGGDGGESGLRPAGLGARDTLRLEAGMPLYGHELHEATDSLSAGLPWCVDLNKDFIGRDRLRQIAADGPARRLVGLALEGRRIARQGATVVQADKPVGEVTSGTFSPTLQQSIAMAYVRSDLAKPGSRIAVDLGGRVVPAVIVALPFYRRKTA